MSSRVGRGRHRIAPLRPQLTQPVEDTREYGEADRQRDREMEARSRGALSALLGRAKVVMKGQENLRNFENEGGIIIRYLIASALIQRRMLNAWSSSSVKVVRMLWRIRTGQGFKAFGD